MVRDENGREEFFVNTLGLGFSGSVALESRQIRRLQGLALYGLAFLRTLWRRFACPMTAVAIDGAVRQVPTLSLTVAIGPREGSFVVAPQACLDDGLFDYLHAGALSRWEVLRYMPRLASGGQLPADHPLLWVGRCREVKLNCAAPLTVHLDGEFFCTPEDDIHALDIRILPGALRVLTGEPGA
jgi:diacylglycerol kinase family enzyme